MPLERVSQSFKDISLSFAKNPLNRDLIGITNEASISRAVQNLVLTQRGERFFNQNLGSDVSASLFENLDLITAAAVKSSVENVIKSYEPRVNLIEVDVNINEEDNSYEVRMLYDIIGIEAQPQQLDFALQQTR
jgi:phage baseplate assembly protein W